MHDRNIFKKQVRRTLRRPHNTCPLGNYQVAEYTTSSNATIRVVYQYLPGAISPIVLSVIRLGKLKGATQRLAAGTYYDHTLDLAYVAFLNGKIAKTIEVALGIYDDLNEYDEILGTEVFDYSLHFGAAQ